MKKNVMLFLFCTVFCLTNVLLSQPIEKNTKKDFLKNHPTVNVKENSLKPSNWQSEKPESNIIKDNINATWYVSILGTDDGSHGTGTGANAFRTIQYAINFSGVLSGDIINIEAGTYIENISLNKSLHLIGAGLTTIIIPAISDVGLPNPDDGPSFRGSQMIVVTASNVEIANLTLDGNNPGLSCGYIRHGVDIDARNGIITGDPGPYTNVVVHDCIIKNIYLRGVYARSSDINFNFHHNTVTNVDGGGMSIAMFNFGGSGTFAFNNVSLASDAISSNWSTGTQYLNNTISNSGSGVHTDNNGGFGGIADIIDGNSITNCSYGIFSFFPYFAPTIQNNNIFYADIGLLAWGGQTVPVSTIFRNNIVDCNNKSGSVGILVYTGDGIIWVYPGNVSATFSNNVVKNATYIADIERYSPYTANAVLHYNSFTNGPLGFINVGATVNATNNWWGTSVESEIIALITGTVPYDPWIGKTQPSPDNNIACAVGPAITLPNSGATIQFTRLGSNNINPTITVQRTNGKPNTPGSAGTPAPVYLQITPTNLANYTFEAILTIDVSSIPGFNENTTVMFSSCGTSWVGANGTYNATAHTYSFMTNHFSTIAFVNPLLSNEVNLYVSTSSTGYDNTIYPNTTWSTPLTNSSDGFDWDPSLHSHDWTYKHKTGTFYIVPVGAGTTPRSFNVATIKLAWNPNIVSGVILTEGNFFSDNGSNRVFTTNMGSNWVTIDASCLDSNQTPGPGKYIAKLDFTYDNDTSGYSPVAIQEATIYYDDGQSGWQYATPVTQNMGGKFKYYLGDFASTTPSSQDMGDGLINGTDLAGFSAAYWSSYTNTSVYRSKYDVGPTIPARYYFGLPHPDGTINFEDLAVFSMGYSKTGSGTLPDNPKPVIFALDKFENEANGTLKLPVKISGAVNDVRAFSMKIRHGNDIEYRGVEMAGEMTEGTKFLTGKSETGNSFMDGASFDASGLSREGIIAYILFNEKTAGNHNAVIESAIARNSSNLDIEVSLTGINDETGIPKTFNLSQNYPNPFNPVTKIEYALPKDVKVSIKIYDLLGREVSVLVNDVKKAGYYKLDWNGSSLASGVYFYQMVAGDFVAVKKMLMIK